MIRNVYQQKVQLAHSATKGHAIRTRLPNPGSEKMPKIVPTAMPASTLLLPSRGSNLFADGALHHPLLIESHASGLQLCFPEVAESSKTDVQGGVLGVWTLTKLLVRHLA